MFGWLKRLVRWRKRPSVRLQARYDAAVTNHDNRRHWANADGLSADAAASPEVRRLLRNRARYEVANNTYAKGIVKTLADDAIGTGPRLQLLTAAPDANRIVEQQFMAWAKAIDLAGKLRTMRVALAADGEAFGVLTNNPALESPVKLDLRLVEADQVTSPSVVLLLDESQESDGIVFDDHGNPLAYSLLKHHPGGRGGTGLQADKIPAKSMIHLFRMERPGQTRGVPELTPALPLFAQLRRYTLAVLTAAETAADFAGVLYTDGPASDEPDAVAPMDTIDLERGMVLTLPAGWRMGQAKAKQPTTTYPEFKQEILNEIARCLSVPYNVAAGNSSGYNYASGRLDHQTYFKSVRVDQSRFVSKVLDRILGAWLREAVLVARVRLGEMDRAARMAESALISAKKADGPDVSRQHPELSEVAAQAQVVELAAQADLSELIRMADEGWPHQWFFDGHEHVDPAKEATAQTKRLANKTTTYAAEYAKQGKDWETEFRQRAKEEELLDELGLSPDDDQQTDVAAAVVEQLVELGLLPDEAGE